VTLSPWERRDLEVIGQVAVNALQALKRIHELVIDPDEGALVQVRGLALTTILEAEAMMEEIDR
jgi:hypothetical protein